MLWAYTSLPTVREVLLLSSVAIRAELLPADAEGAWPEMPQIVADGQLRLESIGFEARLLDLYATSSLGERERHCSAAFSLRRMGPVEDGGLTTPSRGLDSRPRLTPTRSAGRCYRTAHGAAALSGQLRS